MKIKIDSPNGHIPTSITLNGIEMSSSTNRFELTQDACRPVELCLKMFAFDGVVYEGESDVHIIIGDKKYRLIEENAVPLADETAKSDRPFNSQGI